MVTLLACLICSLQGQGYQYKAQGVAESVLKSDAAVEVSQDANAWQFKPKKDAQPVTLIFCPGSSVEPIAYAPLAHAISEKGYPVYLIKMGAQYADLDAQKKDGVTRIGQIVTSLGGKSKVVVGGHSLGAAISAQYTHENPTKLQGLFLCGTTHPRDFDLSSLKIPVTKVYGTLDGIARVPQMETNKAKLPTHTKWVAIEGGNHSQFGWYGSQNGDGTATISHEKQQEQVIRTALDLLKAATQ
jgi:pimeloyl-ACP methyl ester carboxylesterase